MSLNHITIMGRLTDRPTIRYTTSGVAQAPFTVACDRDFRDKNTGDRGVDFINVVAWRQSAEFVSSYGEKGRMIVVDGRLQIRAWTDDHGNKRKAAEIVADHVYFGDSKRDNTTQDTTQNIPFPTKLDAFPDIDDGDLPF